MRSDASIIALAVHDKTFIMATDLEKPKFPADFHWGYATASAQVEGSVSLDQSDTSLTKDPSRWQRIVHLGYLLGRSDAQCRRRIDRDRH